MLLVNCLGAIVLKRDELPETIESFNSDIVADVGHVVACICR